MSRIRKAVVLSGGTGRMEDLIGDECKTLVSVVGRKVLDYVLDGLFKSGISDVAIVTQHRSVEKHAINEWAEKLHLDIVYQKGKGIEGAITSASELLRPNEVFLLAYGDIIIPPEAYGLLLTTYVEVASTMHCLIAPTTTPQSYGVVVIEGSKIIDFTEKPKDETYSTLAIAGAFILYSNIVDEIASKGLISTLKFLAGNGDLTGTVWNGLWVDVDLPWDILTALRLILGSIKTTKISSKAEISSTAIIEGPVIIEDHAVIDHKAVIKGPAYIGKNAFVGVGSFIREHTALEEGSTVGYTSEVKRSSLQPRSTVSSLSYIADSIIGERASLSVGVKTLNVLPPHVKVERIVEELARGRKLKKLGAIIGKDARVGSGTILLPGATVKPSAWIQPLSTVHGVDYSLV